MDALHGDTSGRPSDTRIPVECTRVSVVPLMHVRVFDSLLNGTGSGRVRLLSALPVATDSGTPEMNSGSLHRYLAEAPWYPTVLRPSDRLTWTALDQRRALATLRDHNISVSAEFRFDESGAISAIYTPGRWGSFASGYRQLPWKGTFGITRAIRALPSRRTLKSAGTWMGRGNRFGRVTSRRSKLDSIDDRRRARK